jgi:nitrite reductase/ring-hydroxylating ferredoxin subunit
MPGGDLEGTELTCGCHGSMFSIETGAVLDGPPRARSRCIRRARWTARSIEV